MMTDWALTLPFSEIGLTEPVLRSIGWVLLHSVWQGALIAALLAGTLRLLRSRGARLRYAASIVALMSLLALPVMTWTLLPEVSPSPQVASPAEVDAAWSAAEAPALVLTAEPVESADASLWGTWRLALQPYVAWLAVGWGVGVVLLGLRLMGGWIYTRRLRRTGTPVAERWQTRADALADRLGLPRAVRVLQSARVDSPMVVGWWKPVVLLPLGVLSGLPPQQVEALITHELAHIRRHDVLVGWLQAVAETLLFYHPAVWWISRQVRTEREHCCDDLVVTTGTDRLAYARALTGLADTQPSRHVAFAPAAREGHLLGRIRRLMDASPSTTDGWHHRIPLAVVAALLVAVPIGLAACASQHTTTADSARAESAPRAEDPKPSSVTEPTDPDQPPRADQGSPARPDSSHEEIEENWFADELEIAPDSAVSVSMWKGDSTRAITIITFDDTIRIHDHPMRDARWRFAPRVFDGSRSLRIWPDSMEDGFAYRLKSDRLRDAIIQRMDSLEIDPTPPPAVFFENLPNAPDPPVFHFDAFHPDSLPEAPRPPAFDLDSLLRAPHPPGVDPDSLLERWRLDPEQQRRLERWSERWRERAGEWEEKADVWEEYADRMQRRADSLRRELMEQRPEHLREQAERLRRQAEQLERQARELEREVERDSTEDEKNRR